MERHGCGCLASRRPRRKQLHLRVCREALSRWRPRGSLLPSLALSTHAMGECRVRGLHRPGTHASLPRRADPRSQPSRRASRGTGLRRDALYRQGCFLRILAIRPSVLHRVNPGHIPIERLRHPEWKSWHHGLRCRGIRPRYLISSACCHRPHLAGTRHGSEPHSCCCAQRATPRLSSPPPQHTVREHLSYRPIRDRGLHAAP